MVCCGLSLLSLHISVFFPSTVKCLCLFLFHYISLHSCGDIDLSIHRKIIRYDCWTYMPLLFFLWSIPCHIHCRLDQHIQCKCIFQALLYAGFFPHCVTKSQVHFMVLKMYDLATELIATTSRGGNCLFILPFRSSSLATLFNNCTTI